MNKKTLLTEELESKTAQEIIEYALNKYQDRIALAASFSLEDIVLIDMMLKLNPKARIFTLDTGRLHQETYDIMDKIKEKYKIKLEVYCPDTKSVEEMTSQYGFNLFYNSIELRQLCCKVRKVEPLIRALKNLDAWITGLRREQSVTRSNVRKFEIDRAHNSIAKFNPLADWTEKQLWDYIKENNLPYNTLHDKGYPSIGCEPCTRAIKPGEDIRAGRWWWEEPEKKECGLHLKRT